MLTYLSTIEGNNIMFTSKSEFPISKRATASGIFKNAIKGLT